MLKELKSVFVALLVTFAVACFAQNARPPKSAIVIELSAQDRSFESIYAKAKDVIQEQYRLLNDACYNYWRSRVELGLTPYNLPFLVSRIGIVKQASSQPLRRDSGTKIRARGPITLEFPTTGNDPGPFPNDYKQLLQNTFNALESDLTNLFGLPYQGGVVKVYNMDNIIPDRDAVAGGIYLIDDGTGSPAIWFPVYNAPESAVVNFIHCLYLAYIGPAMFDYDAWSEGMARAATMETCRLKRTTILNGLGQSLSGDILDLVLSNSYDNSDRYQWHNQPPLGNPTFIAPNLKQQSLPPGNSLGGLYLMRYRQGGTAWAKFFAEYPPGFFSVLLDEYYSAFDMNSNVKGDVAALKTIAQNAMNIIKGPNATIEGDLFNTWHRKQYILDTTVSLGRKIHIESIPIVSGLGGNDFGVFAIWASYFETLNNMGDEQLLSGTSFPLYWDSTFSRMSLTGQDDRMDITAGFGSVTPNLPDIFGFGGSAQYYKATVELPVGEVIARTILPAGAIATAANPFPKNFFGTVVGFDGAKVGGNPVISGFVRIKIPGQNPIDAPLRNGAFSAQLPVGYLVNQSGLNIPRRAEIELYYVDSGDAVLLRTWVVNTWGDTLGLELVLDDEGNMTIPGGLKGGVQMIGIPGKPYETDIAKVLGTNVNETLVARWRQDLLKYDMYPKIAPFEWGRGYYVRMPFNNASFNVLSKKPGRQPVSVACQVGWNQITNPFDFTLDFSLVTVQRTTEFERSIQQAINEGWIDGVFFMFNPGTPDIYSGFPEGGTLLPASNFAVGQTVFVRVLVPEGVTLTFRPPEFLREGGGDNRSSQPHWKAVLQFNFSGKETSWVEVGYHPDAKAGYDVGFDALLPPKWGGALQAELSSAQSMYRDIRGDAAKIWKVVLHDLHPGKHYSLKSFLDVRQGAAPLLQLRDANNKPLTRLGNGTAYLFKATANKMEFYVTWSPGK